ncbi:transcriptional activator NhaR [Aestuariibacter sp. AA17]|uniref:Transcriptional activator NhaR n=1 Tax=Fluctibacter corallii TaxID=2984329 RepID=A0ABT3A784_9ALTE|nr:transcriptional activator NhaR [Aestuariibacter sp. AA17]MCV2884547.1 transcriptional activator NhaR [Aestuariibacter sp. AA17]
MQLNYHHLYYFYVTAKEGSIVSACKILNLTPQTVSAQIKTLEDYMGLSLFERNGKRLTLSKQGHFVYSYAQDIFSLGNELLYNVNEGNLTEKGRFCIGVTDAVPKILALDLLKTCLDSDEAIHLSCKEGDMDALLTGLALNRLDVLLSDSSILPSSHVKAYCHKIGESGLTFYASNTISNHLKGEFPQCLDNAPFLIPGDKASQKMALLSWFDKLGIHPRIVAECDDSALLKLFGQEGYGVFCTPTSIEDHVVEQYQVDVIGHTDELTESFYFISPERKLNHPLVLPLYQQAKQMFQP